MDKKQPASKNYTLSQTVNVAVYVVVDVVVDVRSSRDDNLLNIAAIRLDTHLHLFPKLISVHERSMRPIP